MTEVNATAEPDIRGIESPGRLGSQVLHRIRADILSLALAPGETVAERGLESRYGASRTPVREALMQLTAEGLVERHGRGYRIAPLDLAQLRELFDFREEIEAVVVRMACRTATPAGLAALQATVDRGLDGMTAEDWLGAGLDIHVELAALTGNRFLVEAVRGAVARALRPRWLLASDAGQRRQAHLEHSEILRLIAVGDADGAEAAVRRHTRAVGAAILASLQAARRVLGARSFADGRLEIIPAPVATGQGEAGSPAGPTDKREEDHV